MLPSDVKFYKAQVVNDLSTNGGLASTSTYTDGGVAEVFDNAFKSEKINGSTKHRKVIIHNNNSNNESLVGTEVWFDHPTPADDWAVFFAGTHVDTAASIVGDEKIYGSGVLSADVAEDANTISVNVEDASIVGIFTSGDAFRISDMTDPLVSTSGNEEFHTIVGTPSVVGITVTITIAGTLANAYSTSNTKVMSILQAGTLTPTVSGWGESSAGSGVYDESTYELVLGNVGTKAQTWTLEFISDTEFTITGNTVGELPSNGYTNTNASPDNPDKSSPYFTLNYLGFSGVWASGDTITFTTNPSATNIWEKRVIPALANDLATDKITLIVSGESASQ